jgi:putative peptide zinc metalloprotease protein
VLRLREDLVIAPREFGGQACYVIEDLLRGKFFRVGPAEYALILRLDGHTPISQAVAQAAAAMGTQALSLSEALAVCRWLVEMQLAGTRESLQAEALCRQASRTARQRFWQRYNPLFLMLPLASPDRLLERALPWLGWAFSRPALAVWCLVCLAGLCRLVSSWEELSVESGVLFDPQHWLRMALAWTGLKLVHELFHGISCKRFGGHVPRAGIVLLLFAPVAFVDVTSCWRFRSKWRRMAVAAAGIYVELFIAAVALVIWPWTSPGLVHRLLYDLAVMAGLNTLAFNANPLMRFDGYYILSDLLEIPNLFGQGRQAILNFIKRRILGLEVPQPNWTAGKARACLAYGLAAAAWRTCMCGLLGLTLVAMFSYLGAVLAAALAVAWLGVPWYKAAQEIRRTAKGQAIRRQRLTVMGALAASACMLAAACLARPAPAPAPAVVEYAPLTVVRARSSGFVRLVLAQDGQAVQAGQVIAVLENEELFAQWADLGLAIEQSLLRGRMAHQADEIAKYQVEAAQQQSLESKRNEIQQQIDSLTVLAPASGRIIARQLDSLVGQYVETGVELAVIGNEEQKELLAAVPQEDVDLYTAQLGRPVQVALAGATLTASRLSKLTPRATRAVPHPALSATAGGPLPVRPKPAADKASAEMQETYELLGPQFSAVVPLSTEQAATLYAGQLVTVRFSSSQPYGSFLLRRLRHWIDDRLRERSNP